MIRCPRQCRSDRRLRVPPVWPAQHAAADQQGHISDALGRIDAPSQHGAWTQRGFDAANGLHAIASDNNPGTALTLDNLPGLSASLPVLSDEDGPFRDGFD
jgi:hypothetical protein